MKCAYGRTICNPAEPADPCGRDANPYQEAMSAATFAALGFLCDEHAAYALREGGIVGKLTSREEIPPAH